MAARVSIFVLTAIVPLTLVLIALAIVYSLEWFLRRLAGFPKGPIYALCAILGGLGVLLKRFE